MSNPTWHILGFGVIGQLLHAGLRHAEQDCLVIPKGNAPLPTQHTVCYQDRSKTFDIQGFRAGRARIERLIVCTKSYDVVSAVTSIKENLSETTEIIIMVNGLINSSDIAAIAAAKVYWALTTEGGYRTEPCITVHGGNGITRLGSGIEPAWFKDWQRGLPNSHWQTDITPFRWEKLGINAVINPLTALHQCHNGELASDALRATTQGSIDETVSILGAMGLQELAQRFNQTCWEVICNTAANRSSMLQDVSLQRRTEISMILPPLLRRGAEHEVATPQLCATLAAFTARYPELI
jgi:2-dehydropantoate 2-reductase